MLYLSYVEIINLNIKILENRASFPNRLKSTEVISPMKSFGCYDNFISLVKLKYYYKNTKEIVKLTIATFQKIKLKFLFYVLLHMYISSHCITL